LTFMFFVLIFLQKRFFMISKYFKPQNLTDDAIKKLFKGAGQKLNEVFNPNAILHEENAIRIIRNYCAILEEITPEMMKREAFKKNEKILKENLNTIKNIRDSIFMEAVTIGAIKAGK